ncbi:MAG: ubiquitin-binding protein cue5 [Lichina confinis]|nr:MAG: ubiquitin-binding protein cue5 [Lichina confinis]
MSDPTAQEEPTPPPQPPRPNRPPQVPDANTTTPRDQLEADELYARQLAQHYGETAARRADTTSRGDRIYPSSTARQRETGLKPNELDEDDHSFFDDDLPVIKENIRKTFLETQSKVNRWVTDLRKKIDGDESDEMSGSPSQGYGAGSYQQGYGARRSAELDRRSGERDRYDADPRVLGDDFAALELKDDDAHHPRSSRPLANPNLFRPTSTTSGTGSRKVSFQAGPPTEIGVTPPSQQPERRPSPAGKNSKWEPLKAVEPSPMADNDPFSLGDSDDERDAKTSSTTTTTAIPRDGDDGDADDLQKAPAAAVAESIGTSKAGVGSGVKPGS